MILSMNRMNLLSMFRNLLLYKNGLCLVLLLGNSLLNKLLIYFGFLLHMLMRLSRFRMSLYSIHHKLDHYNFAKLLVLKLGYNIYLQGKLLFEFVYLFHKLMMLSMSSMHLLAMYHKVLNLYMIGLL